MAPESRAAEVLFYQLDRQPLEAVLPSLVEKTLERGWRAVIQSGNAERLDAVDAALWTHKPDSFLAHGQAKDGNGSDQPVYLTTREENPNGAGVCFMIDGAERAALDGLIRVVYLFDGADETALARARDQWRRARAQGLAVTYWQQDETGRWAKKA